MNKAELVNALAARLDGNRKHAAEVLDTVIDTIYRAVAKGEKVTITGFGSFQKVTRAARTGRNPQTGETIKVKRTVAPKFRAGQEFKNVVTGAKKLERLPATKRSAAKAAPAKPAAKKASATKTSATKTSTTKTSAAKTSAAKKAPAKQAAAKKTVTKKPAAKKTAAKTTARRTAKKA